MKVDSMKLANAFALATAVLWTLCALIVWILPVFTLQASVWMMHGMDLPAWNLTFSNFLLGGISWVVVAWVTGWILGWSWQQVGGNNRR